MAHYDDLRKKAKDALDTLADVSVEAYKIAEEKAKVLAKRAKLTAAIANDRASVRRLKVEIGGTYYMLHKDAPEEALKQLCDEVTLALDGIAAKQRELEELRNCRSCDTDAEECCDTDEDPDAGECCCTGEETNAGECCDTDAEPKAEECCGTDAETETNNEGETQA